MLWTIERAKELFEEHELYDWRFEFSREKKALGRCFYKAKKITFSEHYIESPRETIENTLLHEIAHAIAGEGHGHDEYWKSVCRRIGAKPARLASPNTFEKSKAAQRYNYVLKCVNESCAKQPQFKRFRLRRSKYGGTTCPYGMCPYCHSNLKAYQYVYKESQ